MKLILTKFIFLFIFLSLLSGCSLLPEEKDPTRNWSANKIYTEASSAMNEGSYKTAIKYYELLETRYPFGKYSLQAKIDLAYAYYRDGEPESALASADRFIRLYPNHPAVAYAYYLKGIVNFNRRLGFLTRFIPTDTSQRDPGAALDSYKDFSTLTRKFPNSEYAEDARKRMIFLRNNLAKFELHVARYYMQRGAFVAAVNRASEVVEKYQRTPAVRDALKIMIEAYTQLDKKQLAEDARRVLTLNEEKGTFTIDPLDLEEATLGRKIWEYFELDKN